MQCTFILLAIALITGALLSTNSRLTSLRVQSQSSETAKQTSSPQPTIPSPALANTWNWKTRLGPTFAPAGWSVQPCDGGEGPLLCILASGKLLGTVEGNTYPLESLPDFQKMLVEAGISPGSVNFRNPKHKAQILAALRAWVADYYTFFSKNRQPEYGDQVIFCAQQPQEVLVGKLPGLRYGFAGLEQGGVREQHTGYVAFDGTVLYVITTAYDPLSETGKFETLDNFRRFELYLPKIIAGLRLPISK